MVKSEPKLPLAEPRNSWGLPAEKAGALAGNRKLNVALARHLDLCEL
jgi:hypothetical protein